MSSNYRFLETAFVGLAHGYDASAIPLLVRVSDVSSLKLFHLLSQGLRNVDPFRGEVSSPGREFAPEGYDLLNDPAVRDRSSSHG